MKQRQYRAVKGQHNKMAVCSKCDRDASTVRFSRYSIDCIEDSPHICNECR